MRACFLSCLRCSRTLLRAASSAAFFLPVQKCHELCDTFGLLEDSVHQYNLSIIPWRTGITKFLLKPPSLTQMNDEFREYTQVLGLHKSKHCRRSPCLLKLFRKVSIQKIAQD